MNFDAEDRDGANRMADMEASVKKFEEILLADPTPYVEEDTLEEVAEYYFLTGQLESATHACDMGLHLHSHSLALLILRIQLHIAANELLAAEDLLEKAFLYHPNDPELLALKGVLLNFQGQYSEAILLFHKIADEAQDPSFIYFHLGESYQNLGEWSLAVAHYKKAIEDGLTNGAIYQEISFCLNMESNDPEAGVRFFKELVDQNPFSVPGWYFLGVNLTMHEKWDEAYQAYDYALALDEKNLGARMQAGHLCMDLEKYPQASEHYLLAHQLDEKDADILTHLGASYEYQSDWDNARTYYQKAVEIAPEWDDAWYGLGMVAFKQKQWHIAHHYAKKAIELNDYEVKYFELLADACLQLGLLFESTEACRAAIELEFKNPDLWLRLAEIWAFENEFESATEVLKEALEELPLDENIHYRLAVYLLKGGRPKEAFTFLESGLALNHSAHEQIYGFFPDLETQKLLFQVVQKLG